MSEFTAISAVSASLRKLLLDHIALPVSGDVFLESPRVMTEESDTGISLWLYRVVHDAHLLNYPTRRTQADRQPYRPIPVNLYYLITPIMTEVVDEQNALGRILQTFNDHPTLTTSDVVDIAANARDDLRETMRISLDMISLEEATRIWQALQAPYHPSLTYMVQYVSIDADRPERTLSPVSTHTTDYTQIVEVD
jgi:hypothetical protein